MQRYIFTGAGLAAILLTLAGCQPTTVPPVTTNTQETQTQTETPATTETSNQTAGREQFGSLVSPDGKWMLAHKKTESSHMDGNDSITVVDNQLYLDGLEGQGDKTIFGVKEQHNAMMQPVPGKRFASEWQPAGWSADGSKAYFVARPYTDGLGGWYPNSNINWAELHQIDVESGEETIILKSEAGFILEGIADFMGSKMLGLTYDDKNGEVKMHNLNLEDKTALTVWNRQRAGDTQDDGISSAMFSPDASQIAIVTYSNPPEAADGPTFRTYRLFIIDGPATGNLDSPVKEVEVDAGGEWEMVSWLNEGKILINTYSPTGEGTKEIEVK